MKLTFIGVGSAFDEKHANVSILLQINNKNILLDCGYSAARELLLHNPDQDFINAIYLTHQHGDHILGLFPYLSRIFLNGRTKEIKLIMHKSLKEKFETIFEIVYPNGFQATKPHLKYILLDDEGETEIDGIKFKIAPTTHFVPNYAVRIEANGKTLCYSGDGEYTNASKALFSSCDLLIHETFTLNENIHGHGNVKEVHDMAKNAGVKKLAIVHMQRNIRRDKAKLFSFLETLDLPIILPEEGNKIEI